MQNKLQTDLIFDHDGGVDDLLSLMLILSMKNINLLGVTITPADCYADDAVTSTLKLLSLYGKTNVPVSVGNQYGPNAFPADFRAQPRACHAFPTMLRIKENREQITGIPAHQWIIETLNNAASSVTLLLTGPASNLTKALGDASTIKNSIEKVIWMGGAIDVRGNVAMHDHDGSAEWNAYWDPDSTTELIKAELPLIILPLDASNALPVNWGVLQKLAAVNSPITDLAGQFWAVTVTAIPSYEFTYFMWDILATALLNLPSDSYTIASGKVLTSNVTPNAGQIWRASNEDGYQVSWVDTVKGDRVINYIIETLVKGSPIKA
jgi:purine nucleosidase